MFSTLEYASRRLKSGCPITYTAATAIEKMPKARSVSLLNDPMPAAVQTACARSTARNAQFSRAPDSRAETTDGASLCASGSQVCRGARPILVP